VQEHVKHLLYDDDDDDFLRSRLSTDIKNIELFESEEFKNAPRVYHTRKERDNYSK
jgi:hypothetical protein